MPAWPVFEQATTPLQGNTRAALLAVGEAYGFNGESNDRHQLVPYEPNAWRLSCLEVDNRRPQNVRISDNGTRRSGADWGQVFYLHLSVPLNANKRPDPGAPPTPGPARMTACPPAS